MFHHLLANGPWMGPKSELQKKRGFLWPKAQKRGLLAIALFGLLSCLLGRNAALAADLPTTPVKRTLSAAPPEALASAPSASSASQQEVFAGLPGEGFDNVRLERLRLGFFGGTGLGLDMITQSNAAPGLISDSWKKDVLLQNALAGVSLEYNKVIKPNFFGGLGFSFALTNFNRGGVLEDPNTMPHTATVQDLPAVLEALGAPSNWDARNNLKRAYDDLWIDKTASLFLQGGMTFGNFLIGARAGLVGAQAKIELGQEYTFTEENYTKDHKWSTSEETLLWGGTVGIFARFILTQSIDLEVAYAYTRYGEAQFFQEQLKNIPDMDNKATLAHHQLTAGIGIGF